MHIKEKKESNKIVSTLRKKLEIYLEKITNTKLISFTEGLSSIPIEYNIPP